MSPSIRNNLLASFLPEYIYETRTKDFIRFFQFIQINSQISFILTGFFARANYMFYRFRTVFRVRYVIRPWYESRVRLVSPFDFLLCVRPHVRSMRALVVFALNSESLLYQSVIIRMLSSKIQIRDSYELYEYDTELWNVAIMSRYCRGALPYGAVRYGVALHHLLIQLMHMSYTHRPGT